MSYALTVISALFTHLINVHFSLGVTAIPAALLAVPPTVNYPLVEIFSNVHFVGDDTSAHEFPPPLSEIFTLVIFKFLKVAFVA